MNAELKQGLRINKALAGAGVCSRRQADELIRQGRVQVNGAVVAGPGIQVMPGDELKVDGKPVPLDRIEAGFTYLMLNKPVQVVSTARDPEGRKTVLDLLSSAYAGKRLYPVGRLDFFSEGLLLLTDDGELTQRLTHPRYHLPKYYEVLVREKATEAALRAMRSGMTLAEGDKLAPVEVRRKGVTPKGELLEMVLRQGVNRQIRRMCRDLDLTILRLCRVGQGPLKLGGLASGQFRELSGEEACGLRAAVGLK